MFLVVITVIITTNASEYNKGFRRTSNGGLIKYIEFVKTASYTSY